MELVPSPSQTIGPFFHVYLNAYGTSGHLAPRDARGERIRLVIRVLDGDGAPLNDAMLELWQGDIGAFGRLPTDEQGGCVFESVKPERVTPQAPHINVSVFARGLLNRLITRVYFAGDPANERDPVLALVPEDRRGTLLAHPSQVDAQPGVWNFEIHLCGERETVFFDI